MTDLCTWTTVDPLVFGDDRWPGCAGVGSGGGMGGGLGVRRRQPRPSAAGRPSARRCHRRSRACFGRSSWRRSTGSPPSSPRPSPPATFPAPPPLPSSLHPLTPDDQFRPPPAQAEPRGPVTRAPHAFIHQSRAQGPRRGRLAASSVACPIRSQELLKSRHHQPTAPHGV
jgi:hypothetical protein